MKVDAVASLRIINNQRLMRATHRGEYRDMGGALALTSDAPPVAWNCLEGFTTDERRLEGLLDIGFSLLRAFDQAPAVRVTPLDRPRSIADHLQRRGLVEIEREMSMIFRGNASQIRTNPAVTVKVCTPEDAGAFTNVEVQARPVSKGMRPFLLGANLANIIEKDRTFYLAYANGEPVGTTLVVRDGSTAGIYSVGVLKMQRKQGIASTLVARAISDAQSSGADLVCLETVSGSDAMRLWSSLGFEPAHESVLWSERGG
ncbi:MAG TPA: GNAT family N-acetyltransferase [Dehalococcoidia bacterium]|jgi:predicted GNAT family acetyltransferase